MLGEFIFNPKDKCRELQEQLAEAYDAITAGFNGLVTVVVDIFTGWFSPNEKKKRHGKRKKTRACGRA